MAAIGAGVLGVLCLSSSVYAAISGGGGEETPALAPTPVIPDTETETNAEDEADSSSDGTPKVITGPVKGQYVRLSQGKPYQNQDAYALETLELEVYDSSGTNIAQGKSASSRTQYPGNNQPVLAFDGSLDTKYHSNHDNEEDWLEVDIGSMIDIHKIVIRHADSETVYKGVAVKDRLRGYIEIFDDNGKVLKTSQIEETSTNHVYTYNFKERGGGRWRGGQGILKTRADLIAEKQAADAAAADAEQKRLALVAEKAATDKAAADKAAADKAAAAAAAAAAEMLPNGVYTLRGGRGGKLCADEGNRVICNRDAVGAWEKFTINKEGNAYTLRGGRNGKLCADEGNKITCNRDAVGAWEKFTVEKHGDKFSLKGGRNQKYCADDSHTVQCNRDAVLGWEKFTITPL